MENNKPVANKYVISNSLQLIRMFHAGHGTFFFYNHKTGKQFNLRFKRCSGSKKYAFLLYWSEVWVCFNDGLYVKLGRYNFRLQLLQLASETENWEYNKLQLFVNSFKYVKNIIVSGSCFSDDMFVHYDGCCCRCGRSLETQESIEKGIGPECEWLLKNDLKAMQLQIPI